MQSTFKKEPKDLRIKISLSVESYRRLRYAEKTNNDKRLPHQKRITASKIINQLILDNIKDHTYIKQLRLNELRVRIEKDKKEINDIQLFLKKKAYENATGSEKEYYKEELEKLEKKLTVPHK